MATLVLRAGKGSPLTNAEVDANFTNLNTEVAAAATTASWSGVTGKPATLAGYGITDAQPVDADLTAIAALAGTSGFLKKTAANTWALDTATYLTGINSSQVTTALGFTPYNATNPSGYITASASITGNAASATRLINLRTINGVGFDGTANITVADATKLPLSGGTVAGVLIGNGGFANVDGGIRIANPGGASYATSASTVTGAIKIRLPAAALGSNSMISFRVRVYQYSTGLTQEFVIAGYNYSDAAGTWYNVSALNLSDAGGDFTVRFGKDATSQCVYIGELNSSWSYPQVHVVDFSGGYSGMAASTWATDWNISFETSAFAGVTSSRTAWRSLSAGNYNSYAPSLTGTGASGTWGISITGSAATLTTGRTIALTGDVTYTSGSFNGSANVTGTATLAASGVTAGTYTKVTVDAKGRVTVGASLASADLPTYTGTLTSGQITTGLGFTPASLAGATFTGAIVVPGESRFYSGTYVDPDSGVSRAIKVGALGIAVLGGIKTDTLDSTGAITQNGSQVIHAGNYNTYAPTLTGTGASGSWGISVTGSSASTTGNAATATALQTARTIGGVSFNGTANINLPGVNAAGNQNTTGSAATLTTARTLTIGSTGKTFNGSANVAWSLAEIGALGASAKAADSELLDGYNSDRFLRTYADSSMEAGVHGGNLNGTNMQYLLAREQVQNLVAYVAPTSYETWNGSAWVSATVPTAIFRNKPSNNFGGLTIANGVTKVRFTWVGFGYKFWSTLATAGSTNGNSFRARIYTSSDNVTWVERFVSGYVTDWPGYHVWPTYYGDAAFPHMRIELEFTYVNANTCTFGDIALWGAYGGYTPLFDWDYNRNITLGGDLQQNNATYLKGKLASGSSTRLFGLNSVDTLYIGSIDTDHTGGTLFVKNGITQMSISSSGVVNVVGSVTTGGTISATGSISTASAMYVTGQTVLHAGNYSSYSPSLTGSGASGTWGINVTGNAATVTNGLVSTGSYADPSWITSLASSKLTGTIDNARLNGGTYTINVTGNAGTATTLQTARSINNVSFNGSANITIPRLLAIDDRTAAPADGSSAYLTFGFGSWNNNNTSPYADFMLMRSYTDSSGGNDNMVAFRKDAIGMRLWQGGFGSATAFGTVVDVLHSGNFSSYALPLSGGTVTGQITGGLAAGSQGLDFAVNDNYASMRVIRNNSAGPNNRDGMYIGYQNSNSGLTRIFGGGSGSGGIQISGSGVNDVTIAGNTAINAGNYTSYSPSLTGSGASGTWGINVTGNAASATTAARASATTVPASTAFVKWLFATTATTGTLDWNHVSNTNPGVGETLLLGTATNGPGGGNYYHPFNIEYSGISGVGNVTQMAVAYGNVGNELYMRGRFGGTWTGWSRYLNSSNYTSYSPSLTGSGASGSWGISVTGSAATLTTARTLWGQSFNGSANVTGALSSVTTLAMSGQLTNTVAVGTAPFVITSTTRVANLNVATAGTADTLTTARTINGTSFNGSANITTANWGTARTLTIGSTGKSVDGSANVAWTLAEIGAAAASHTHSYLPTSGGTLTSSGSSTTLHISDTGVNGANIKLTGDGATTPSKFIRAKSGLLEVINNAYTASILQLTDAGNLTATGNVTAYSDERLKKDWAPLAADFIERLASVKSGTYTRIDNGERQAGSSAQDWQELLPEVVTAGVDDNKTLALAYGNAALVSAIELAKKVVEQDERIKRLEALVEKLIGD